MSNHCGIDPYLTVCKNSLCVVGQWPYQLPRERIIIRTICHGVTALIFVPGVSISDSMMVIAIFDVRKESTVFIECIPPLFTVLASYCYAFFLSINMAKMRSLTDRMKSDWRSVEACKPELEIIEKATKNGQSITTIFTIYSYISVAFYVMIPLLPQVLDIVAPLNETRPKVYVYHVNYMFMENDNNYYFIFFHSVMASYLTLTNIIASDFIFLLFVQHACGMFQLLGYRLNHVVDKDYRASSADSIKDSKVRQKMVRCIQLYDYILNFIDDIQCCFSTMFIFIIGINMALISFQGVQIVLNLNNAEIVMRFGCFFMGQIIHLFFSTIPGQMLIDESSKVSQYCYNFNWTEMTVKSQKLLLFMILRSSRECKVSAGKMYVISMQNFSSIIKTSFSYLSVLSSAQ